METENLELQGVKGWLLLFCLSLTIFTPLTALIYISTSYQAKSLYFNDITNLQTIVTIDTFCNMVLIGLSIRAGIMLWQMNSGAVKAAKTYLLASIVYAFLAISFPYTFTLPENMKDILTKEFLLGFFSSLPYFAIWYSYLKVSKRVKITYATRP